MVGIGQRYRLHPAPPGDTLPQTCLAITRNSEPLCLLAFQSVRGRVVDERGPR